MRNTPTKSTFVGADSPGCAADFWENSCRNLFHHLHALFFLPAVQPLAGWDVVQLFFVLIVPCCPVYPLLRIVTSSHSAARREAGRQARLLLAHAPKLNDLVIDDCASSFMHHLQQSYREVALAAGKANPRARASAWARVDFYCHQCATPSANAEPTVSSEDWPRTTAL